MSEPDRPLVPRRLSNIVGVVVALFVTVSLLAIGGAVVFRIVGWVLGW